MSTEASAKPSRRWRRWLVGFAIFVVGLVAGTYFDSRVLREPFLWLGAMGQSYMAGEYSRLQYHEAAYPEARQALRKYLLYLESAPAGLDHWKPGQNPWLDERGLAQEKAMTLARVAILDEQNGRPELAERSWSAAEGQLTIAKWKNASRRNLRTAVDRQDETYGTPSNLAATTKP